MVEIVLANVFEEAVKPNMLIKIHNNPLGDFFTHAGFFALISKGSFRKLCCPLRSFVPTKNLVGQIRRV